MATNSGEKTCFIAMPVRTTSAHAEHYGDPEHWHHVMEMLFVPAVEAAGFTPWLPVATGSHLIHAEIVRQLEQADMVLCDMSHSNPNVFFELGVRTSVNKPVALVRSDANVSIPFDVSGINTHTYDPQLRPWSIADEVERLAEHLQHAETSCAGENPMWRQFGLTLKATEPTSGGSKEEAMLSVVSNRLAELTERVNDITVNDRSIRPFHWSPGFAQPVPIDEVLVVITSMAAEHNQQIDAWFDPNKGLLVRHLAPTDAATKRFRAAVRRELEAMEIGAPVRFYGYRQSD